jgi:hypothetical protein
LIKCVDPYTHQGIEISGRKLCAGEKVTLTYSGLLASSGADKVFVHYGYGDSWDKQEQKEMSACKDGFEADIDLKVPGSLNICFRDSAGNWDNNSNINYSFKISAKKTTRGSRKKTPTV